MCQRNAGRASADNDDFCIRHFWGIEVWQYPQILEERETILESRNRDHCNNMALSTVHYLVIMGYTTIRIQLIEAANHSCCITASCQGKSLIAFKHFSPQKGPRSYTGEVVANPTMSRQLPHLD